MRSMSVAVIKEKYIAALNALVAKYTLETLGEEQKRQVDDRILDLLLLSGIRRGRARHYRSMLRETQYYGMAAIAMAFLGIRPALPGSLFKERWAHVVNPLVSLTNAEREIETASNEIQRKHGVQVTISDADKRGLKWLRLIVENRTPRLMN